MREPGVMPPQTEPVHITHVQAYAYEAPIPQPVRTSFGVMHARPAVFVRMTDKQGNEGWGEVWCNFPSGGAAYKRHLVNQVFAPMLEGQRIDSPQQLFNTLTGRTEVLTIQCGEPGPMAHCIAGIDVAIWDLLSRRAQQPLWKYLGGRSPEISTYASGINPERPVDVVTAQLALGHRAFKLKIGFDEQLDLENLRSIRAVLNSIYPLMADANQAWDIPTATHMIKRLKDFDLEWIEEPVRADRPWDEWQALCALGTPLAGGENLAGAQSFAHALQRGVLTVVQPDLAKWGGFSGCLPVARNIVAAGKRYCPHFLGGGIGLLASAHLLAASGGDGMLEIDVNTNPLRDLTGGELIRPTEGRVRLDEAPGLGHTPDLKLLQDFEVRY